jgi:hypothetical protein
LILLLYLIILTVTQWRPRRAAQQLGVAGVGLVVFAGTQLYWIVPFLAYPADHNLPLAATPWIPFARIGNGISGIHPWWTGGIPAVFHTVPVDPIAFALPLIAFLPLTSRLRNPELLWLCLVGILAVFLIKQDNPPFGLIYDWMFAHVPGWRLFRETSKLFFVVALAYSLLLPVGVQQLSKALYIFPWAKTSQRALQAAVASLVLLISMRAVVPLERGQVGYTTVETVLPGSFVALESALERDRNPGTLLWLGGALTELNGVDHHFKVASTVHPLLEASGVDGTGDPLTMFCSSPRVPFCYLDPPLLRYLLKVIESRYVVAPVSAQVGRLPNGITRQFLYDRLAGTLGVPQRLGSDLDGIAVWKLSPMHATAVAAPTISLVTGGPGATVAALPALEALNVPALYATAELPDASRRLPETVSVVPPAENTYEIPYSGEYVLLAAGTQSRLSILDNSKVLTLPRSLSPARLPEWGAFGPVFITSGTHRIEASGRVIGPLVAWSSLSATAFGENGSDSVAGEKTKAERITVRGLPASGWVELKTAYDPGWHTTQASTHVRGDGLFNLYYTKHGSGTLTFQYSTSGWETLGEWGSILWTLLLSAIGALVMRRTTIRALPVLAPNSSGGSLLLDFVGRSVAWAGLILLALGVVFQGLAWFDMPSRAPSLIAFILMPTSDPYGISERLMSAAVLALTGAVFIRILSWQPLLKSRS